MHTLAKISLVMSAMVSVFPAGASGGGVVTECTEAALRAAMAGWGSVTFACDGTITVSNTVAVAANTTLDAMGHRVTLSGGQTVGVLYVNSGATLTLLGLTIANGYSTKGSAIYNAGTVDASSCLFLSNSAAGMAGPTGMHGYNQITFGGNAGDGGPGGDGKGGALFNSGSASFVNCSFVLNSATGGQGGQGGQGGDGIALYNEPSMGGWGGNGGHGGDGLGAALYCTGGTCRLTNCTVTLNSSLAGSAGWPGQGGWGQRVGYAGGPGPPGYAGVAGTAGDALMGAGLVLINTLLDSNNGGNGFAGITDAGHNLSSDSSCAFTNTGSLNSSDPNLLPLASNGGPTLTMAPLPRSPAIDAGDSAAAPATDQRGFARPFGPAADIGAFEYGSIISPLSIQRSTSSALDVSAQGIIGTTCVLMTSSNLAHWRPVATNQIGSDGMVVFHDTCTSTGFCRFYRLMLP